MLIEKRKRLLFFIFILGFSLRLWGAISTPLSLDEKLEFTSAKEVSFESNNLNLPLIEEESFATIGDIYLRAVGFFLFGKNHLGGRLPYIILSSLAILVLYFLVKLALGIRVALFSAFLLSISQYHIGISKHPLSGFIDLFIIFSLIFFYRAIKERNIKFFLFNGLIIGLGYWMYESVFFMIPIYIIFLLLCSQYRGWLKEKYLWASFFLAFFIALPNIYLSLSLNIPRVSYVLGKAAVGISLNALGIYLGEIILYILRPFFQAFEYVAYTMSDNLPAETFIFGLVILAGVVYSLKDRRPFIRLLLVCFLFNFILFSFIRSGLHGRFTFLSLKDLQWASIGFIPGLILAANMLVDFARRRSRSKILICFLVIFMFVRAVEHVTFPLNAQVPIRDFQIEKDNFQKAIDFFREGDRQLAKDILQRIYKVSDKMPQLKERAALKLFLILETEENEKAKDYLESVLSREGCKNVYVFVWDDSVYLFYEKPGVYNKLTFFNTRYES